MALGLCGFLEVSELVLFLIRGRRLLGGLFFLGLLEGLLLWQLNGDRCLFCGQNLMVWLGRPLLPKILYLGG
jgi:hypothetical protein